MSKYGPSLSERKRAFLEDACAGCGGGGGMGTDPGGDGVPGFSGEADASGPVAGLDKALKRLKRKRKNGN